MSGRRSVNLASVWIVMIFTVIAVTLVAIFLLLYSSIQNRELRYTLREQITVLSDNANVQVMEPIRNEAARRLTAKAGFAEALQDICVRGEADSLRIRTLSGWCADVNAAIPQSSHVDIYFPGMAMVVGSEGVRFLDDKKYTVQASNYAFLLSLDPADSVWIRRVFRENALDVPYVVYARPCPGIFTECGAPMIVTAVQEEKLHTLLKGSLRTLEDGDGILLTDFQGVVWSAADASLVGTQLPLAESSGQAVRLQNGEQTLLTESSDPNGRFMYVLARHDRGWLKQYDHLISTWVILCVMLLCAGLVGVLLVLMKHYGRPMRRLMRHFAAPGEKRGGGGLIDSPSEHFLTLETALQDMDRYRKERGEFLRQSRPVLQAAWLNCLISGEAHYTAPMPQLGIEFPHPFFQVALASAKPSPQDEKTILDCFPAPSFTIVPFDSREKERVYLINHGQDASAVTSLLRKAGESLETLGHPLAFGVGILATAEDMIPASFRCARRALSSRYFGQQGPVFVFDVGAPRLQGEEALSPLITDLYNLTGVIRRQPVEKVDAAVEEIVARLKESVPSMGTVRALMLLAAMFLCKAVYDVKGSPEEVYGDNLMNAYYHIEGIDEFASRLRQDSLALSAYLAKQSAEGNRSVVQYAIHHIRNTPPAELSIQSIADALSISTGHLSRMFHQETGKKLVDYLQEIRMEHAARLLAGGIMTNEQICEEVGYSRLQYFSAKFREYYGLTLNEYRRRSQLERKKTGD